MTTVETQPRRTAAPWPTQLAVGAGLAAAMAVPYFAAQHVQWRTPTVVPATAVDRLVPFQPAMAWAYLSLYGLVVVVPLRLGTAELRRYAVGFAGMAVVSAAVFFLFPTTVPRPIGPARDWAYRLVVATDRPTNACPSMHAAMAAYAALAAAPRQRWWAWAWAGLILYSTLATRQHASIDLLAGTALAVAAYAAGSRPEPRL